MKSILSPFLAIKTVYDDDNDALWKISLPLLRNFDTDWQWTDKKQLAYDRFEAVLAVVPMLKFPVPDAKHVFYIDVGLTNVGALLSHIVDKEERVLGYANRTLSQP